ncbi:striated muscle preferentially expressed protein kinase [Chanos chanos]|uniref:non-specific serine/threonine protein kinase n=1 Tax=Chanos chanos TaxID=29144 RepID=A0A6J2W092_CHACN|nr:striated muscle preferentially expressed protein kinase [Chanos chanos]
MTSNKPNSISDQLSLDGQAISPTPPVFLRKLRQAAVATGCDVRLRVSVGGFPRPTLYWYCNDIPVDSDDQDYGGLWIRDCRPSDGGLYTCVAVNDLGETRSSAVLAVLELGEDSESTEDETAEAQVSMETKERSRCQGLAANSKHSGDGTKTLSSVPDMCDGLVVEREMLALGSRAPGFQDPSHPGRQGFAEATSQLDNATRGGVSPLVQSTTTKNAQSSALSSPMHNLSGSDSTTVQNGNKNIGVKGDVAMKNKSSKSSASSQSSDSQDSSALQTPKISRKGSKIFDKVRAFEERRHSVDLPKATKSGRSWAGFSGAGSFDSDDGGRQVGSLKDTPKSDVAQKRSIFKQRASSLEDRPTYAQKVQNFQSKFSEELQRIKRLVGKTSIKKAFSTEQLSQTGKESIITKVEPIEDRVIQKLKERGSVPEKTVNDPEVAMSQDAKNNLPLAKISQEYKKPQRQMKPQDSSAQDQGLLVSQDNVSQRKKDINPVSRRVTEDTASPDMVSVNKLAGRESPRLPRKSTTSKAPTSHFSQSSKEQPPYPEPHQPAPKKNRRSPSPVGQTPPPSALQEQSVISPPKPPRLGGLASTFPRSVMGREEKRPVSPGLKLTIPTIVVEDEPMDEDEDVTGRNQAKTETTEGKTKPKRTRERSRRGRPTSPEQADSSDDSYMSAEESPAEAPAFELPLKDVVAAEGSEVLLKCVIVGNPVPEVTWRKGTEEIKDSQSHTLKVEGDRHSLRIRQMKPDDSGEYAVTAVNRMGQVSCKATLFIQSEPVQVQRGNLSLPLKVSCSSTPSDEEFLSPIDEGMEFATPTLPGPEPPGTAGPPTFQVALGDQTVIEGQEVGMSVQVCGQPQPTVHWLRDGMRIQTDDKCGIHETDYGKWNLKIKCAQRNDAGVYTCKIVNKHGTAQTACRLEVKALPTQAPLAVTRPVQDVSVRAGETALFECHVTGPPEVEVDWLANGKLTLPALLDCKMHFDGKRCCLLLRSVHEDDSGNYTCKLSTATEELVTSAQLRVIPSQGPLFTHDLETLEVVEGRTARFDCKVSGSPPPDVTWRHCEQQVVETENVRIVKEGGRHSLIITHVTQESKGSYTATARNVHGQAESSAQLCVQEPRPSVSSHMAKLEKMPSIPEEPEVLENEVERRTMPDFVKPLSDLEVIEGKEAVLKCKVSGMPYPTIAWYHNGKKIDSSDDGKMTQYRDVHSLVIRSVCHGHSGVYKTVISNKVGKAACYAHLYVTDVHPEPPDGPPVIESITGRTITLSWKKPKNLDPSIDPGSLVYTVQQQALGSIQWTTIASNLRETSYTVTALSKSVRYAFRVLSSTGKTFSKPSQPTDLVQLIDRGQYLRKAPVILDKPDVVYVVENQPVNITITLNHVQATVTWKKRGVMLTHKPGTVELSMPDDDQHSLRIVRVKSSDIGQLICMATNQYGSDLCTLQLAMAAPPMFETIMEDLDVCVGETTRFAVVVDGKPDPDILWYKDNIQLSESNHFTFVYDERECSLVVLNARQEDSGVYTCTAKNLAGSTSCKAELTVLTAKHEVEEEIEDEETILRKMRRLTDYYDLHKEIGRGTSSYVKRVTLKAGKVEYAAKFISTRGKRKTAALREMSILSELDHDRILYFHDAFERKNFLVIITELCHEELMERLTKKTTILESEIRSTIRQLLEGICYLHQNDIVHLDIKPENILMADRRSDQIRICDFGNALKLTQNEDQYCRYGTPEFIAPEIVNQTPVSKATDIWPVGVITYLCLTGVSPFAGENDRGTLLNIRNYNVAFEESMFADLCREAKGFVIKLLVADRLRPNVTECLRHPWFKTLTKGKSISTSMHKQVLARRKWQRSLISYKSKMVMRSIPELLDDSSSHVSLAVPRNLKEGSPPPSSSSDSDEDIDELPFIPMPLTMVFSGSRMSLTEIHDDDDVVVEPKLNYQTGVRHREDTTITDPSSRIIDEEPTEQDQDKQIPLKKGSSMDAEQPTAKSKRALMRRGSSADSALLLHITPEEGAVEEAPEDDQKNLKKALSMELPCKNTSPNLSKLSKEDYALKLELMRQRLLRGGSVDKKMSGLRGPLLETLGVDNERRTSSLDRNLRRARMGASGAVSTESPGEGSPKNKASRKSVSFSQGDPEPMPLHRRSGAPLEIPSTKNGDLKSQEATAALTVTEKTKLESQPASPREISSKRTASDLELKHPQREGQRTSVQLNMDQGEHYPPKTHTIPSEDNEKSKRTEDPGSAAKSLDDSTEQIIISKTSQLNSKDVSPVTPKPTSILKISQPEAPLSTEHPAVFAKVASPASPTKPTNLTPAHQPVLRTDIKDIDSEAVFEARFKKRESSLTRGLKRLTRARSEEKSVILPQNSGEQVYRPGPTGAPLEFVSRGLQEKSKSVQDLRDVEKDPGLGLIGRLSMRAKKPQFIDKKDEKQKEETIDSSAGKKRVSWALGRSKSLDKKVEMNSIDREKETEGVKESKKVSDSPVLAMKLKFESKVAGISERIRSRSDERKESKEPKSTVKTDISNDEEKTETKKVSESPVLAMRKRFESKVSSFALRGRSQSADREGEKEAKSESKKAPLTARLRHSLSEGSSLKKMDIPENQLASQFCAAESKDSLDSTSSSQSLKPRTPESERRSRWDRWGLSRNKKDKSSSQSSVSSISIREDGSQAGNQYIRSASDFPPVFHIKLKDHILLEGDPVTLSCLPAGSPNPKVVWMKDKKPLEVDDRMNLMASPDGRQLLMIMNTTKKDAGLYECVATNPLASATSSCTISLACIPKRPGTPEIPQTYNNTALVTWKPADTKAPCTYTLERKTEGDANWLIVATGVTDCYYNATNLPSGSVLRFRVACVNKAGQGPYSSLSGRVGINTPVTVLPKPGVVRTLPLASSSPVASTMPVSIVSPSSQSPGQALPSPPAPLSKTTATPNSATAVSPPTSPTSTTQTPLPLSPTQTASPPGDTKAPADEGPGTLPKVKSVPPLVLPKPKSPINVVPPITQTQPVSPVPVLVSSPTSKPQMFSTPTYTPATTARVAPTPISPSVVMVSSMSPIGEAASSPTPETPTGRVAPSAKSTETALRQGVPQKPYTFLDEKARGRFGVVRDCRENATGKMFMAKIVPYEQETKQVVVQEYEILKSLRNERIMALHEAYVTPRYLVLITECCTGKEILYSLIDRFRYSEDDVVGYIVQILQGLEYIHNQQILHLDIKPDNIMVTHLNVVKIIDFGSAQSFNPLYLRHYSKDLGTLEYMAPELLKGEVVGPPADIWSLGVVTYVMLSGRLPFLDKDPHQTETKIKVAKFDSAKLYPNVSQSASTFLKKILNSYPWSRPTTKDCFNHAWLQDSYLMKLRRQTLTFTTTRLKEFLGEHQRRRAESATKHKVLLRAYQGGQQSASSPNTPDSSSASMTP